MKSILSNNKTHWRSKKFVNENNFVKEGIQSNYLEKFTALTSRETEKS